MINYVIVVLLSCLLGQIVKHLNLKMPPLVKEEIKYKEFLQSLKQDFKLDIKYSLILIVIGVALVKFLSITYLIYIYLLLTAILLIVFSIDYRFCLIPDEVHIGILILGLINVILNINTWYIYLLGLIAGSGIFVAIALLSIVILKKEGMGFGDVKLMGALGFLFGLKSVLVITLLAFFMGAIFGSFLLIINRKKKESYMPFGPFIVIGAIILMFIQPSQIIDIYLGFCASLSNITMDAIFKISN